MAGCCTDESECLLIQHEKLPKCKTGMAHVRMYQMGRITFNDGTTPTLNVKGKAVKWLQVSYF